MNKNNKEIDSRGIDLLCEAAAALFDDPQEIAELISPEEAAELEELQREVIESIRAERGYTPDNDCTAENIAAEEE